MSSQNPVGFSARFYDIMFPTSITSLTLTASNASWEIQEKTVSDAEASAARPRCYKDLLKQQLLRAGIDHRNWETRVRPKSSWSQSLTKRAVQSFEEGKVRVAQEWHRPEKEPIIHTSLPMLKLLQAMQNKNRTVQPLNRTLSPMIFGFEEISAIIISLAGILVF